MASGTFETLEEQLADQLRAVEIPDRVMVLVRQALKELHGHEKAFRDVAITALRRRQDEVQKKQDVLLDRLLDGTVAQDVYNEKYTALQNEKAQILVELEAHERANQRYFEETETLVDFANRLGEIFAAADSERKMAALKVVASNTTLEGQKARLNLRPAFAILAKTGPRSNWLRG